MGEGEVQLYHQLKMIKCIHKVYMLRCVGTPRVCTHNAFHTPRPFVHPIKITISLCKKRTSVNFEHIFFELSSYADICHMPLTSTTEGCQQKVDLLFKKAIFPIQNG